MSRQLSVGSLFTGVAGFDMGFEWASFEVAWQVEIDRDCNDVLARHYPNTLRLGDVREVAERLEADPSTLPPVDVLVFGSPCQGFSVAGKGEGLSDERSGLFAQAIRIIGGLRPGPALVIWENVPGAFTTEDDADDPERDGRGRDFAAVLAALANLGALDIAWRVLDSQGVGDCVVHRHDTGFWAVPQRRRRIFLVADFGGERASEVLALAEGVSRHPQARRKSRQRVADAPAHGAGVDRPTVAAEGGPNLWPHRRSHGAAGARRAERPPGLRERDVRGRSACGGCTAERRIARQPCARPAPGGDRQPRHLAESAWHPRHRARGRRLDRPPSDASGVRATSGVAGRLDPLPRRWPRDSGRAALSDDRQRRFGHGGVLAGDARPRRAAGGRTAVSWDACGVGVVSHRILVGDVLDQLRTLPDESIQMAATSPPYLALRDYGLPATHWPDGWYGCLGLEPTVEMFIEHLVMVFAEVWRVLRKDGVLFVNIGDSYAGSGKGPTGHNGIGDQEQRQGFTGRGAAHQAGRDEGVIPTQVSGQRRAGFGDGAKDTPGAHGRPLLVAQREGRGIRTGKGYELADRGAVPGLKPKDLMLVPERFAIAMQQAGWWVRSRIVWAKTSAMPESVHDRPTSAWEVVLMFSKSRRYFWDKEAVRRPLATAPHGPGNAKTPAVAEIRGANVGKGMSGHYAEPERVWGSEAGANLRNVWIIGPEPSRYDYCLNCDSFFLGPERSTIVRERTAAGAVSTCPSCQRTDGWVAHYAAFPTELVRRCILAATSEHGACAKCGAPWKRIVETKRGIKGQPEGTPVPAMRTTSRTAPSSAQGVAHDRTWATSATLGWQPSCRCQNAGDPVPCVVLDPFLGSGSTLIAARHLGRQGLGIDLNPDYAALARHRIERDVPKWARPVVVPRQRRPKPAAQRPLFKEAIS